MIPPPHSSMTGRLLHHLFLPGKNLTDDACRARLLLKFPCIHFSLLPPPPPPPQDRSSSTLSPAVIILIAVLSSCFLLVSYYAIIVKLCSRWSRRSRAAAVAEDGVDVTNHDAAESDLESVNSAVNFIWYVHTVGLDESVITSITVCKYKKGGGLVDATDCSVCLAEFREDEDLRLLPKCGHAFHVPCIDTWLASHVNCPLCRAAVVVPTTDTAPPELQVAVDMESSSHASANFANDGQNSVETTEEYLEAAVARVPSSRGYYSMRVPSDLAGNIGEDDQGSVSMNSSVADSMGWEHEGECSGDHKLHCGIERWMKVRSSKMGRGSACTSGRRIAMKRCYSNGGRLFHSRSIRNSSSLLPI